MRGSKDDADDNERTFSSSVAELRCAQRISGCLDMFSASEDQSRKEENSHPRVHLVLVIKSHFLIHDDDDDVVSSLEILRDSSF